MPRVSLSTEQKEEYMIADLPFLFEKEARKRGLYQKDLAKALGITQQAYNARKNRQSNGKPKDSFSYGDILKLFRLLGMSDDEILKLFSRNGEMKGRNVMAVKGAKSIAEYAIRKYLQEQLFDAEGCTLEMNGHEGTLTDQNGDSLVLVYDPDEKSVYTKGF